MASIAYVLNGSLAYFSYLAGITEWPGIAGLLIIIPAVNITFYILIRTGVNLKFADPSLTFAQMCAATLAVTEPVVAVAPAPALLRSQYPVENAVPTPQNTPAANAPHNPASTLPVAT